MQRLPLIFASLLMISSSLASAQDLGAGLRGGLSSDDSGSSDGLNTDDEGATGAADPGVFALRGSSNDATAENGSTGLSGAGRVSPARPFADRLAAVRRLQSAGGPTPVDSAFDGDTSFDQAEGIRLGTFTILPDVTISGGWTDNTSQTASGSSGKQYTIAPNIAASSGWSRHQLDLALRGSYVSYPDASDDDDPNLTASAVLRLDLNSRTTVNGTASYTYSREDASSAESSGDNDDIHQLSAGLGVTRDAGLLAVTLRGALDRNVYTADDDGSTSSGRDNSLYSANLRLDANTGASLSPFVEGSLLVRRYDRSCSDSICEKRDANGYQLRGGVNIASGPKLSGEIGAGWRIEDLDDARLDSLSGMVVDASLVWSPTRLTTVTGGLGTSFEATDIDGASGSIIYSGDLRVAHEFSDRIVGEAGAGYNYRTYQGASIEEQTFTGLVGMTFALTQNIALRTEYSYQKFTSSSEGADYDQNTIQAGVRFRH